MPRLKMATVKQKLSEVNTQISQLTIEIDKLKSHNKKLLQSRYVSRCPAGGTSFSGKEDRQSENYYWVLYQSNPRRRIRNVSRAELATVRKQVEAGKQLTRLNKQLDKLLKQRAKWMSKL